MSKFIEYIGSQFGNPRGSIGKVCCLIMNVINKAMYRRTVSLLKVESGEKVLDMEMDICLNCYIKNIE